MLEYLEARNQGNKFEKCRYIGKVTFWTKFGGYLEPMFDLMNYNTMVRKIIT